MLTIYEEANYEAMSRRAAHIIAAEIHRNPECVLGLATGSTPIGTYKNLVEWNQNGDITFQDVQTVNLDEYKGLSGDHDQSYRKTYAAGTMYGQILQDALDADGIALKVWNGQSSAGFDGWYNPTNAAEYLNKAIAELAEQGIEISAENPIYIDMATRTDSQVTMNMKQVVKQSVEAATGGKIKVNLVECATRDIYLAATYRYTTGDQANFDINDGSGWGPDYGDPSTYLGTMLPDGDGYMTKSLGLF